MPHNFSNKCPSLRILCILKDAKVPLSFYLIRKHISQKYTNEQIAKALQRLVKTKYIRRIGAHKNNLYIISSLGLDYFYLQENRVIARNYSDIIFDYLLKIGASDWNVCSRDIKNKWRTCTLEFWNWTLQKINW